MKDAPLLIVIGGPTASGKSALSMELAQKYGSCIISADSRQIYKGMDIGTAKPSKEDQRLVPHYFIDILEPTDTYSAASYEMDALCCLDQVFTSHKIAIACGGTGFYLKALTEGLDNIPTVPIEIVNQVTQDYENKGLLWLQTELKQHDPQYAKQVDLQNPRRLIRALGVIRTYEQPFSSYLKSKQKKRPFQTLNISTLRARTDLYQRINKRVDHMINEGLMGEVESLLPYRNCQSLDAVGYKEWFPYFDGQMDRASVIEKIKQNSRRYAKRQMTWFRNQGKWRQLPMDKHSLIQVESWVSQVM